MHAGRFLRNLVDSFGRCVLFLFPYVLVGGRMLGWWMRAGGFLGILVESCLSF